MWIYTNAYILLLSFIVIIEIENISLEFEKTSLEFLERGINSTFKTKNNKTLGETLEHSKYKGVKNKLRSPTNQDLAKPLGEYLFEKKNSNDLEYKLFLNKYGDNTFCHFKLKSHLNDKGIYIWVVNGEIKYLGRCSDNFKKRVNQGYGKINAKNCFIDGQATNCHLNSKINEIENIEFYVHKMNDKSKAEIDELELNLLNIKNFEWNIQNNKTNIQV